MTETKSSAGGTPTSNTWGWRLLRSIAGVVLVLLVTGAAAYNIVHRQTAAVDEVELDDESDFLGTSEPQLIGNENHNSLTADSKNTSADTDDSSSDNRQSTLQKAGFETPSRLTEKSPIWLIGTIDVEADSPQQLHIDYGPKPQGLFHSTAK